MPEQTDRPQPDSPISNDDLFKLWLVEELQSAKASAEEVMGALCDVLMHALPSNLDAASARQLAIDIKDRFDRERDRALLANTQEAENRFRQRVEQVREDTLATAQRASERTLLRKISSVCSTNFSTVEEVEKRLPELVRGEQRSETIWEDRILYTVVGAIAIFTHGQHAWVVASYTSKEEAEAHAEAANIRAREIGNTIVTMDDHVDGSGALINEYDPDHTVDFAGISYEVQEAPYKMRKSVVENQTSVWDQLTRES